MTSKSNTDFAGKENAMLALKPIAPMKVDVYCDKDGLTWAAMVNDSKDYKESNGSSVGVLSIVCENIGTNDNGISILISDATTGLVLGDYPQHSKAIHQCVLEILRCIDDQKTLDEMKRPRIDSISLVWRHKYSNPVMHYIHRAFLQSGAKFYHYSDPNNSPVVREINGVNKKTFDCYITLKFQGETNDDKE